MAARLVAVAFDAREPAAVGRFWAELLGRDVLEGRDGVLLPGDERQAGLRFVAASTEKTGPNRLHLHLTSATAEAQRATVERALGIGGCHLDVGQLPEEGHVELSDPGGNKFRIAQA